MTVKHRILKDALGTRLVTTITLDTTQQTAEDLAKSYPFPDTWMQKRI